VTDVTEAIENGLDPTALTMACDTELVEAKHLLVTHRGGYPLILTPDHTPDPS